MDLLFTVTNPDKNTTIDDSDFKNHFPSINLSTSWRSIEPYIRQATEEYLIPYIGNNFYDEVVAVNAGSSDMLKYIQSKCKDIVAYYTIWLAMPHLNRVISDLGVQENSSTDGNSQPSSMWRYKNSRWETMVAADKMLDRLLIYMESNVANLSTWKNSDEYNEVGHPLFRTTKQLAKYTTINSRRLFKALMPYFDQAIDLNVVEGMCREQYEDLLTKIDTGTAKEKQLIEYLRKAIANYTMYRAIPHLRVSFESNALLFVSSSDGMNIKQTALKEAIDSLRAQLLQDAKAYLSKMQSYLYTYVDDFPIYKEKSYSTANTEMVISSRDKKGGIMVL